MNDEIKEIDNSDLMELLETTSKKDFYRLTLDHELVVRLYNWITNLQEEKEDYKSRCEKAIKYINNQICVYYILDRKLNQLVDKTNIVKEDLLNILNGDEE